MKYDFDLHMENENSLSLLLQNVTEGATVLEFGPASGRMTKYMKEELDCKVYLVELDEVAGQKALQYGQALVTGDIENYVWLSEFKDIKFDHIIFADVLEHLRNPLKVLQNAKELLTAKGTILLSVPNLGHNSVVIDLLNNKFEYQSTGLLDDTHIHFFTKTSLEKMVMDANLFAQKKMATYAPVGTIEIENSAYDVEGISAGYWKNRKYGEVYQYVYVLSQMKQELVEEPKEVQPHYLFEVYFDKNEMWNAENRKQYPINSLMGIQKFHIDLEESYNSVRIDPIDTNCLIEIVDVVGITTDGFAKIELKAYNAKICYGNIMLFDNQDPMIIYGIPEGVFSLEVTIKYVNVDFKNEDHVMGVYHSLIEQTNALQMEMAELRHQHDVLQAELQHANNRLQLIEQSKLYKLYKLIYKK